MIIKTNPEFGVELVLTTPYAYHNRDKVELDELPNNWIHGVNPLEEPAVLDYSEWEVPPYREHYKNKNYDFGKMVFISNKYNVEHGHEPFGYFDIQSLYDMFSYLVGCGYEVIYNTVLSCLWDRPVITYVTQGKELRDNYFGKDSYFQRLSNQKCIPVFDIIGKINDNTYGHLVNNTGENDYTKLLEVIKNEIK